LYIYLIKFTAVERLGFTQHDNSIDYNVKSIKFELNTHHQIIKIYTTPGWDGWLTEALRITKNIWEYKDEDLKKIPDFKHHIKYDLKILHNYLEYAILM